MIMMPEKKARKTWSLVTRSSPLPGFRLSMGFTLTYLTVIVLSPLMAILLHGARLGFGAFPHTVTAPRLMASYRVTLVSAAVAAPLYGTILAASRSIGEFGAV
jgi:sulfate transport system permease protein